MSLGIVYIGNEHVIGKTSLQSHVRNHIFKLMIKPRPTHQQCQEKEDLHLGKR